MPMEWFQRPFLMMDESQHERFLSSSGIINPICAQYLLYKVRYLFQRVFVLTMSIDALD